jgi:hypothetical protein
MSVLNFPTNPTTGQLYSFGDKTWYWTGQGWRLTTQGAINGIPVGNITPSTGDFTALDANNITGNTLDISGAIATGNATVRGTLQVLGNAEISGVVTDEVDVYGNVVANFIESRGEMLAPGNITTYGYFVGNGRALTGIVASSGSYIEFGNTSVEIPSEGANVIVSVANVANVAVFSSTGLEVAANITANVITANTFVGNISGNLAAPGTDKEVLFNDSGVTNAVPGFQFDKTLDQLSVTGNIVSGGSFVGSGVGLTETMVNRGGDTTNWNVLLQMGTYTVNRTDWGGVTGPPLDSLVYVGLLEVKNSSIVGNQSVVQTFYPGTIDDFDNVKIQFVRNYWDGAWTPWIKMTNDDQQIDGGTF